MTDEKFFVDCEGKSLCISKDDENSQDGMSVYSDIADIPYQKLCANAAITLFPQARSIVYYYVSVPFVENEQMYGGLCWAACAASRINYKQGKSLNAPDLYNVLNNSASSSRPSGTPVGSQAWIQYAYSYYGISTVCANSGLTVYIVENLLRKDTPISCAMLRYENGERKNHEVLLRGIYQEGTTTIYMFMDPNFPEGVSVRVDDKYLTSPNDFVYTDIYGTVYTGWCRSIY